MSEANGERHRPVPPPPGPSDGSSVRIGALVPLTRPGWVEAGRQLLAGLQLGVCHANAAGGIAGRPLELVVRDTAADPDRATAAVDELAALGVTVMAGEYHSVAARAAAVRADARGLRFLCSSAVIDALTERPSDLIARLAPAQSHGWRVYADFLLAAGHHRIALATEPSAYWNAGIQLLRDHCAARGATVIPIDVRGLSGAGVCDALAEHSATAVLLLVGSPDPAVPIVRAVRRDARLADVLIGAPAGQPEFGEWLRLLGRDAATIPFLRYLPERLGPRARQVEAALLEDLGESPSFVALEGYDTVLVLADVLRAEDAEPSSPGGWPDVTVDGTRGPIRFSRVAGIPVWQWAWAPVQVAARDPAQPGRFRVLHAG